MKGNKKYLILSISNTVANSIYFIGALMLLSMAMSIANGDASSLSLLYSGIPSSAYIFVFGLAATVTVGIFSIIYYIFEERKLAVLISAIVDFVISLFMIFILNSMVSALTSSLSSLFGLSTDTSQLETLCIEFILVVLLILVAVVYDVLGLLQSLGKLHLAFLDKIFSQTPVAQPVVVEEQPAAVEEQSAPAEQPAAEEQPTEVEEQQDTSDSVEQNDNQEGGE
jgi:hypothetical protein